MQNVQLGRGQRGDRCRAKLLREQNGRVAFSRMTITYETANPGGSFLNPIERALSSLGSIFGTMIAILIVLAAMVGPLLAAVLGLRHLARRMSATASETPA